MNTVATDNGQQMEQTARPFIATLRGTSGEEIERTRHTFTNLRPWACGVDSVSAWTDLIRSIEKATASEADRGPIHQQRAFIEERNAHPLPCPVCFLEVSPGVAQHAARELYDAEGYACPHCAALLELLHPVNLSGCSPYWRPLLPLAMRLELSTRFQELARDAREHGPDWIRAAFLANSPTLEVDSE